MLAAEFGTGQVFWSMLWFFLWIIWIWLLFVNTSRTLPVREAAERPTRSLGSQTFVTEARSARASSKGPRRKPSGKPSGHRQPGPSVGGPGPIRSMDGGGSPMTEGASTRVPEEATGNPRLAILLAMAMFVLVVDTSLMNVSISAVVRDLDTTVSGVQSAIALEALVSAAFILIGGKVGDLIRRKRAYVLGLLGYAVGALAMALAQGVVAIIVFWALLGGLGASLLLPAMQSLIHGNFEGAAQRKVYALVGAAAAIAAAVGPLLGGFITTYLSWRVAFLLEVVVIAIVLSGIGLVRDVQYTGPRGVDAVSAVLSILGMGGIVLGILVWQEGGESVAAILAIGAIALAALVYWLRGGQTPRKTAPGGPKPV